MCIRKSEREKKNNNKMKTRTNIFMLLQSEGKNYHTARFFSAPPTEVIGASLLPGKWSWKKHLAIR